MNCHGYTKSCHSFPWFLAGLSWPLAWAGFRWGGRDTRPIGTNPNQRGAAWKSSAACNIFNVPIVRICWLCYLMQHVLDGLAPAYSHAYTCAHNVHDITLFLKQTSTCLMMFERSKFSGWDGTYKVLTCSELKSKLLEGLCNVVQVHATLKPFTERLTTFCHINNSAGNCFVRETFSNVSSWFACIVQAA